MDLLDLASGYKFVITGLVLLGGGAGRRVRQAPARRLWASRRAVASAPPPPSRLPQGPRAALERGGVVESAEGAVRRPAIPASPSPSVDVAAGARARLPARRVPLGRDRRPRRDDGRRRVLARLRRRRLARPVRRQLATPSAEPSRLASAEGGLPRERALPQRRGPRSSTSAQGSGADLALRGSGCVAADLDRDGHTDLFVTTADARGAALERRRRHVHRGRRGGGRRGLRAGTTGRRGRRRRRRRLARPLRRRLRRPCNARSQGATQGFPSTNLGVRDLLYLNEGGAAAARRPSARSARRPGSRSSASSTGSAPCSPICDRDGDLDLYVANDTKPEPPVRERPLAGRRRRRSRRARVPLRGARRRAPASPTRTPAWASPSADYDGDGLPGPVRDQRPRPGARRVPQRSRRTRSAVVRRRARRSRAGPRRLDRLGRLVVATSTSTPTSTCSSSTATSR